MKNNMYDGIGLAVVIFAIYAGLSILALALSF